MLRRIAGIVAFASAACACQLVVSLDGLSDGDRASSAEEGGAPDAEALPRDGESDGESESGGEGGVAPLPVDATPLRRSGSPSEPAIAFVVDGRVSFGFTAKRSWQLVSWHDLSVEGGAAFDLGYEPIAISEPIQVGYDGLSYGTQRSEGGTVEIVEENAARAILKTTFAHRPPHGSVHTATTTYAIYADGRIVEATAYVKTSGDLPKVGFFEFGHTNVTTETQWDIATVLGGAGFELVRTGSPTALVAATHEKERGISDDDPKRNRFWIYEGQPLYSGQFSASWEYRFYGASSRVQREAWVRSVGVAIASPAYDKTNGAWVVDAKGASTASFELPSGAAAKVIAARSGTRIVVLYSGSIAAGADATARTIHFSAP
ncbi:MAG: hypothetical protein KIT84_43110 [Labilithrix sp.]|nr:hypothetical protein [Labilithrix sp.]MCW5817870.1 hypothetical protein [Labilithrix sp.]